MSLVETFQEGDVANLSSGSAYMNETNRPEVSVVVPIYNRSKEILQTVDSVIHQTLNSSLYEVLLIDDGSTDDTMHVLTENYSHISNLRIISIPNRGVARARNRGLEEARGKFIAFLDHDDAWRPHKLECLLDVFKNAGDDVAVVAPRWTDVDEQMRPLPPERQSANPVGWRPAKGQDYSAFIPCSRIISMSVPLIRTDVLRQVGGFDPAAVPCDDWDLWLRITQSMRVAYVDEDLVLYRRHDSQQSSNGLQMSRGELYVLTKQRPYLRKYPRIWLRAFRRKRWVASMLHYFDAKKSLVNGTVPGVLAALARGVASYPPALFERQWLYLLLRLLRGQRAEF